MLRQTVLGVQIYAVGGSERAARLTGIKVNRVLLFVYGVSGLLAGLAGIMSASRLYSATGMLGQGYELDAFAKRAPKRIRCCYSGWNQLYRGYWYYWGNPSGCIDHSCSQQWFDFVEHVLLLATSRQRTGNYCGGDH